MTETTQRPLHPGSFEARRRGCTCPALENRNGEGVVKNGKTIFVYTDGCPVHDRCDAEDED